MKICVGVDGSQNSRHAFETAVKLLAPGNTLYVVHIETEYSNNDNLPQQYRSKNVMSDYTNYAKEAEKQLGFKVNILIKLIEGTIKISDGLVKFAADNGCQILCVGADGMTAYCNKQPILGSVSDECVKILNVILLSHKSTNLIQHHEDQCKFNIVLMSLFI